MFDKSSTWKRFSASDSPGLRVHLGHVPELEEHPDQDRRRMVWAIAIAVALHLLLVFSRLGWNTEPRPVWSGPQRTVYVIQPVRFEPPPAPSAQEQAVRKPREKKKLIPMPDLTPDDPEPRFDDLEFPEVEIDDLALMIPEAPVGRGAGSGRGRGPSSGAGVAGEGPLYVGGNVSAPKKIFSPQPIYTEEARQERVQGVVILQAVIDEKGNVAEVEVVRGLPQGLTEAAVETVKTWRFEPARDAGKPVPVYFTLTISFSVQ